MFSYIFMKILENRPEKYDSKIGSHSKQIRNEIISNFVKPDINMLDIGCGTGELIEKAAKIGANATGIDISKNMLSIANKRIENLNLQNKVKLFHFESGVVEMDTKFEDNSFDLVTSTLLISELYGIILEDGFQIQLNLALELLVILIKTHLLLLLQIFTLQYVVLKKF